MAKGQRWRRSWEKEWCLKRRVFVVQDALKYSSACALFENYTNVGASCFWRASAIEVSTQETQITDKQNRASMSGDSQCKTDHALPIDRPSSPVLPKNFFSMAFGQCILVVCYHSMQRELFRLERSDTRPSSML